jgi:hypothetical protein
MLTLATNQLLASNLEGLRRKRGHGGDATRSSFIFRPEIL